MEGSIIYHPRYCIQDSLYYNYSLSTKSKRGSRIEGPSLGLDMMEVERHARLEQRRKDNIDMVFLRLMIGVLFFGK